MLFRLENGVSGKPEDAGEEAYCRSRAGKRDQSVLDVTAQYTHHWD